MSDIADKPFPSYLEMPSRLPVWFWWAFRLATIGVMLFVVWKVWTEPELGFALFWKLLIPSLPLLFAVAPGVWRQICPMAFVNQLPRTFGFSRELTLPVPAKNLAYFISVLAFFFLVSLRHIYFNQEPLAWMVLVFSALGLAFLGGVFFKGRSGWCGTFCPLAPIQKAYGHAPLVTVKNGYCPTCVGCQKNCYDFNPRAAFLSDLTDKDLWYAGHKKFFVAGLPGFAIGFFTAADPAATGLPAYFLHMASWIVTTLGIYMAARIFIRVSDYLIAAFAALSALNIFYWFTAEGIITTAFHLAGSTAPDGAAYVLQAVVLLVSAKVIINGLKAEQDFRALNDSTSQPKVGVKVDALRAGGANTADDLVTDQASGRSFAADPGRSLLDGIESAGLTQDFGCRMGMCGADAIAIVDGMENLSPPGDDELATLRRLGLEGRARMACVCKANGGGVTIDLNMDPNDLPEPPPPADQIDLAEVTGVRKIVIIGNGTSGMAAADEIRRLSPTCKIDVIARENHPFYNRMAIGRLLYGRTGLDDLYLLAPDWYEKKNVDLWLNTRATDVDREKKLVKLGTGESLPYDKLIMAQGASAAVPPAEGVDKPGCFVLREAVDAQAIRAWRQEKDCTRAVVQGGGVLGVEAADALRRLNLDTTIVQRSGRLMNRELDERGSELLEHFLETLGIHVVTGASVAAIKGDDRVEGIELTNGDIIPANLFVTCAGVKANTALPEKIGLEVNRGIVVDAQMRTSDPDILAVGDVAELPGTVGGLWAVGTAQAAVAAQVLFGREAAYKAPNTMVSLKMDGIDVKGYGNLETGDDVIDVSEPADSGNLHRRLVIKDGILKGAVFVGPPGTGKDLAQVIQSQVDLSPIIGRLQEGDWKALGEV
ncbi:FAD-dependent oxidoreductase [Thalassospiraceae bacterium LMO-JJ14]|nr:FAD-dependent oxidoreductase [Thalassospiraceae bacterium LMO-JJ14]